MNTPGRDTGREKTTRENTHRAKTAGEITTLAAAAELVVACGLDLSAVAEIVEAALAEDLGGRGVSPSGSGTGVDVTSLATIPAAAMGTGRLVARRPGTVAGVAVAAYVLAVVAEPVGGFSIEIHVEDGDPVERGDQLVTVTANTRALLRAERVALNLLTLMSGVATATATWVEALAGTRTQVRDTRKTVPGLRVLQKYAVRVGGGRNHRMSLADMALIKDNHVIAAGGVVAAFLAVRRSFPDLAVQVEVTSLEQAHAVVEAGAVDVLLDNMSAAEMTEIVAVLGNRCTFEASGGLTLSDAQRVADTGVDFVAVGAITHSAPILDVALDLVT